MTFVRPRARILELSTTSGGGPLALAGAADGSYNTFGSFMSVGDQTYVTVVEPGVAFWTGIATYSAAGQITLTTVEETKGSFGAGTKEIMASPLASASMFREDIAGAIVTGGTSTAYTVASYRKYDSLARLDGNIIAFTPHATNGQNATLNVDGLGAKPLRLSTGVGLESGVLVAGTPYIGLYNNADGAVYLHGLGGNAYGVPLGGSIDYWGATSPSTAFALMYGQAISRTAYAALFAILGTTFGAGDGSTTFNIPDLRGRFIAGKDDMGGAAASRLTSGYFGASAATLGATGGSQSHTLSLGELPGGIKSSGSNSITVYPSGNPGEYVPGAATTWNWYSPSGSGPQNLPYPNNNQHPDSINTFSGDNTINVTSSNTGGGAHSIVPPAIVANKLLRVI